MLEVFGKLLVMLDFSSRKVRLVNVCSYRNPCFGKCQGENEEDSVGLLDLGGRFLIKAVLLPIASCIAGQECQNEEFSNTLVRVFFTIPDP
jgi:hypothetical protein